MNKKSFSEYTSRMLYLLLFGFSTMCLADKIIEPAKAKVTNSDEKNVVELDVKSQASKKAVAKKTDAVESIVDKSIESGLKVGVVNSFECMGVCGDGLEARESLESKRDAIAEELKQEEQELMKQANQFKVEATTMSDEARQAKEKDLLKRKRKYDDMVKEAEEELKSVMQRKTETLARDFEATVNEYGREKGLDIIADKATGRLVFVADDLDVTGDIIKKMDTKREIRIAQSKKQDLSTAVAKSAPVKSKTAAA